MYMQDFLQHVIYTYTNKLKNGCSETMWAVQKNNLFSEGVIWRVILPSARVISEGISYHYWLVVEPTPLKNMLVKLGIFPQIGMNMKNIWSFTN